MAKERAPLGTRFYRWFSNLPYDWLFALRRQDRWAIKEWLHGFVEFMRSEPKKRERRYAPQVDLLETRAMPTAVYFNASSYSVLENAGAATITAVLDSSSANAITVNYATRVPFLSTIPATPGVDYSSVSGTLTFAPSVTSQTFTVTILDDSADEYDEEIELDLSNPSNATLGTPASVTLAITDDDAAPTVQFSSTSYSASEGAVYGSTTVTLSAASGKTVSVVYTITDGTAGASDYSAVSPSTLSISPGNTAGTIVINITDDSLDEYDETVNFQLSSPSQATLGSPSSATLTILDNDAAPTVAFGASSYTVGEAAGQVSVSLSLTTQSAKTITVAYGTSDGTATAGSDYTAATGTVTFNPGATIGTFTVPIIDDGVHESDETVILTLSSPSNTSLGTPSTATLTIQDNDAHDITVTAPDVRSDDPQQLLLLPFGEASVDLNLGAVRVYQPLDFDLSPGTDVGGNPFLVYNSATTGVRPVIKAIFATDAGLTLPNDVQTRLTWNGSTGSWTTFNLGGHAAGDEVLVAARPASAVTQTGLYDWRIDLLVDFSGGGTSQISLSGQSAVVVRDSTVSGQQDYLGAGWGITGVDRLVAVSGGVIFVSGSGEGTFFADAGGGGFTSPSDDHGTLTQTTAGYTYTLNGSRREQFDSDGYMTSVVGVDNSTLSYAYDATYHRLTQVIADDGSTSTLAYDGTSHYLQTITEPGSRSLSVSYNSSSAADLTTIADAEGGARSLSYDSSHKLNQDGWSPYNTQFSYTASLLTQVDLGLSSTYGITSAASQGLNTASLSVAYGADESKATVTDPLTHTTTYELDARGRALSQTDPLTHTQTWDRNAAGLATLYTDADGNSTSYAYDAYGQLAQQINPDGGAATYSRDHATSVVFYDNVTQTVESPVGITTQYAYDGSGRLTRTIDGNGSTSTYAWSGNRMTSATDPYTQATTYDYDASKRLTKTVDADNHTSTTGYDSYGNVAATVDPNTNTVGYTYDKNNRLRAVDNPVGGDESHVYAVAGFETESVFGGITTSQAYDQRGWLTRSLDGVGATTLYNYDVAGRATGLVDARGYTTTQQFDAASRATKLIDASGATTTQKFDNSGYVTQSIDPDTHTTTYAYDGLHRLVSTIDPNNHTSSSAYDASGRLTRSVDGAGVTTTLAYDKNGNVTKSVDGLGVTSLMYYDKNNQLTASVDGGANTWQQRYDAAGYLTAEVDADGNTVSYAYDGYGYLTQTIVGGISTTTQYYDAAHRLTRTVDAGSHTTTQEYDTAGRVTRMVDGGSHTSSYAYDNAGRLTWSVDAAGVTTSQTYDKLGNVTQSIDGLGVSSSMYFDPSNRLTLSVDGGAHNWQQRYDAAGYLTAEVDANGHTVTYAYDGYGNLTQTVVGGISTTTQYYDAANRLTKTVDAGNHTTTQAYDAVGRVTQSVDGAGHTSTYAYDNAGRLTLSVDGAGATTSQAYDHFGNVTASTDGNGHTALFYFDAASRLTMSVDAANLTTQSFYDPMGLVTRMVDSGGRTTTQAFDSNGWLTSTVDGGGRTWLQAYDALGRVTSSTDAAGYVSASQYDANGNVTLSVVNGMTSTMAYDLAGRLTRTVDADLHTSLQQYDSAGFVTAVVDGNSTTSQYAYDAAGRRTRVVDPDGNTTTFAFDAAGNVTRTVSPNGYTTTQAYDGNNQVTQVVTPDGGTINLTYDGDGRKLSDGNGTFTYDGVGQMLSAANANGTYSFSYDASNRLTHVTEPFAATLDYAYDSAGNQTQVIDSIGGTTVSTYDGSNYLTRRTHQGQGLAMRVDFANDGNGNILTLTRYSDLAGSSLVGKTVYQYDSADRVTDILSTDATPATINDFTYSLTAGGQVTQIIEIQNGVTSTISYGYDAGGQLTNDNGTTLTYDGAGNRTGGSYAVTTGNQMSADASWTYSYDKEGNLTEKDSTGTSESWTYAWSTNNLLTEVKHYDSGGALTLTVDYSYNAFGDLIQKDDGSATERFVYDGWNSNMAAPIGNENMNVVDRLDGASAWQESYLWGNQVDQLLGRALLSANNFNLWPLEDRLGSIRDVINDAGTLKDSIAYDGFGNIQAGELDPAFRGWYAWTGRQLDVETDLQYNHARWYDGATGRWISQDPLGFDAGDSNLYRYVNNRPTNATDPSGEFLVAGDRQMANDLVDWMSNKKDRVITWDSPGLPAKVIEHNGKFYVVPTDVEKAKKFLASGDWKAKYDTDAYQALLSSVTAGDFVSYSFSWGKAQPNGLSFKRDGKDVHLNAESDWGDLNLSTPPGGKAVFDAIEDAASKFGIRPGSEKMGADYEEFLLRDIKKIHKDHLKVLGWILEGEIIGLSLAIPLARGRVPFTVPNPYSGLTNQQIVHSLSSTQLNLLRQWMGTGVAGVRAASARSLPAGLQRSTLEAYREIAIRQIANNADSAARVQAARLRLIEEALRHMR